MTTHNKKKLAKSSHTHAHAPFKPHKDILSNTYKRLKAGQPVAAGHAEHEQGPFESIREIEYNGHRIIVRTQYEIKVDGKPLSGHVYVDNSGRVSTHAMPNYSFTSAVDLIKKIIDAFPANFPKASRQRRRR